MMSDYALEIFQIRFGHNPLFFIFCIQHSIVRGIWGVSTQASQEAGTLLSLVVIPVELRTSATWQRSSLVPNEALVRTCLEISTSDGRLRFLLLLLIAKPDQVVTTFLI